MKYVLISDIADHLRGDELELAADDPMVLAGVACPVKEKPKDKSRPSGVSDGDDK